MKLLGRVSAIVVLLWIIQNSYSLESEKSNTAAGLDVTGNLESQSTIDYYSGATSLPRNYTADEINSIIYDLYDDFKNSNKTELDHYYNIAVLIDLICSDERYEKIIEACDVVTELRIEPFG